MENGFRVPVYYSIATKFHCAIIRSCRITAGQVTAWRHDCVVVQVPLLHVSAVKGFCRSGNDTRNKACRWVWKLVKHSCMVLCVGPAWIQAAHHIAAACLSHPPLEERQRTPRFPSPDCSTVPQDNKQGSQKGAKKHFALSTAGAQQEPGGSPALISLFTLCFQPQNDRFYRHGYRENHSALPSTTSSHTQNSAPIQMPTLVYKGRA